ncbi:PAS domain-containing protein [Ascidiaceihabitans sp.]|uniref:PAS domain-containing protein n=1 Tax=Ascidiaceihabitans sp. TaxID=1872644 RepID=UPI00329806C8
MHDTIETHFTEDELFHSFAGAQVAMIITNPNLDDNPIVYVNQAFTAMTGYKRSAIIGRNCRFLQGENTRKSDVDQLRQCIETNTSVSVDILNYRSNGEPFTNRLVVAPIQDAQGRVQFFMGIQKELSPQDVSSSANETDERLVEIQNRVRSDLSMIINMIRQQSTQDSSVPEDFAALSRRVETLQVLYGEMKLADANSNRDGIQLGNFLSRLIVAIAHVQGRPGVRMNMQLESLVLPIETAARVGLVVSELLTNAFQHAFERLDQGMIEVRMSSLSGGGVRLTISDDGVGIPTDMAWPDPANVGGRIVNGLIEGLEGTLHLGRGAAGSFVTIDVPAGGDMSDQCLS